MSRWPWQWLVCLWVAAAASRIALALPIRQPQIFTDELAYWQLARSFGLDGSFLFHGRPYDIPAVLYSILISPLFRLTSEPAVFDLVRVLNAFVMPVVLFPAYGLAAELLSSEKARRVAVLTVLLPGGVYTSLVMAENLYFPLVVLTTWCLYRTLVRGRFWDAFAALVAISLTFFVKPHVLVLVVAYGLLVLIWLFHQLRGAGRHESAAISRAALIRGLPFGSGIAIVGVRAIQAGGGSGGGLRDLVGGRAYASFLLPAAERPEAWVFLVTGLGLLTVLVLGMGIVPVGALCLSRMKEEQPEEWRWVAAFAATMALGYVFLVTRHTVLFDAAPRFHERYLFVVTPLFLILLLREGALNGACARTATAISLLAFVVMVTVKPAAVMTWNVQSDSPSLAGFFLLWRHVPGRAPIIGLAFLVCGFVWVIHSWIGRGHRFGYRALAGLLVALNIGWYLHWYEVGNDLRAKQFAARVAREMKPGDRLAVVVDRLDPRLVWALEFWLRCPLSLYSGDASRHDWWLHASGSIEDAFLRSGATLVVVATDLEPKLTERGAAVLRQPASLTPVSLLRRGLARETGDAAFESDPSQIKATYVVRTPLSHISLGGTGLIELEVRNVGRKSWPAGGENPVGFGYHWSDPDRTGSWQSVVWDDGGRGSVSANVGPGEVATVVLKVKPPPTASPTWRLVVSPLIGRDFDSSPDSHWMIVVAVN